jgi:prephenate dehydrogenase
MNARPGLGVVGFGAFGRLLAEHLGDRFAIVVTDRLPLEREATIAGVRWGGLREVAGQPHVVFAVPVQDLESAARAAAPLLRSRARVYDVASVKSKPLALLDRLLPKDASILGLHPMFGPQSARSGLSGLKVVLCRPPAGRRAAAPRTVRRLLEREFGLAVLEMTPERHDHQMAYIQGLTHWFARALREIELPSPELATVAYQHMLAIEENLRFDSDALFLTIQRENPSAPSRAPTCGGGSRSSSAGSRRADGGGCGGMQGDAGRCRGMRGMQADGGGVVAVPHNGVNTRSPTTESPLPKTCRACCTVISRPSTAEPAGRATFGPTIVRRRSQRRPTFAPGKTRLS